MIVWKFEFIRAEFILNFLCRMFSIEICIAQLPPVNLITFNTRWSQKYSKKFPQSVPVLKYKLEAINDDPYRILYLIINEEVK